MLESLIKTGWCNEFLKLFYGACRHTWLNLKSKTYYGVFGLNRQEMRIAGKTHDLQAVERAYNWKASGLAITEENLKMVKEIWSPAEVQRLGKRFGTGKVLKYLRQCTRRNGGNGKVIDSHITSDWIDYIRMAEKLGLQLELDIVRFPLDLKRRHNELASQVKEQQAMARASQRKAAIEARAQALEEKFSIKKIMRKQKNCTSTPETPSASASLRAPQILFQMENSWTIACPEAIDIMSESQSVRATSCSYGGQRNQTYRGTRSK